jgi:5'-nucleotidase
VHRWTYRGLGVFVSLLAIVAVSAASPTVAGAAAKKPATLTVLVTNDEGVGAAGLDALVSRLRTVKNTKVVVVAPASNQSGAGSKTTPGSLTSQSTVTASGYAATAVEGYPADAVITALDSLQVRPNVVISGISSAKSLGPDVDQSGAVGAAREAARRGIPALAVSEASAVAQFDESVRLALGWLRTHRSELLKRPKSAPSTVDNLNVPMCPDGSLRGLLHVDAASGNDSKEILQKTVDCSGSVSTKELRDDVHAFMHGYATITVVPTNGNS